jgi:hypothetical protein
METSSRFPDTSTQDPRGAGGPSPDGPETLNKPGLNRIGDGAVTARDKTTDGTEQNPRAAAVTSVTTEHLNPPGRGDHLGAREPLAPAVTRSTRRCRAVECS